MVDSLLVKNVESEIENFKNLFKDNPVKHIEDGTWFTKVLQLVLSNHNKNLTSEYYLKKYVGLSRYQIAQKLIKDTSTYTGIIGGVAAAAITVSQLTILKNKKVAGAAILAAFIGEISYIAYLQLTLIYNISVVFDAKLEKDDPEDLLTIFWYSLGINAWEQISFTFLKANIRTVEFWSRKLLRAGIRNALKEFVAKFGGVKLASKVTEKTLLKMIVPGINVPVAFILNRSFTKSVGKKAIDTFQLRYTVLNILKKLDKHGRQYQLVVIPLIFHVGIIDIEKSSKNVELQYTLSKYLDIDEADEKYLQDCIEMEFDNFCEFLTSYTDIDANKLLFRIAEISSKHSGIIKSSKLLRIIESLRLN